jgi:hypothetical protein
MAANVGGGKRMRLEDPTGDDFMRLGRSIWSKDPVKSKALATEDRKFREFFGCSNEVACILWIELTTNDLLPDKGTTEHLLWTLLFMKVYAKENTLASLADGKPDPKTFQRWVWAFIPAIALLETRFVRPKISVLSRFLPNCMLCF